MKNLKAFFFDVDGTLTIEGQTAWDIITLKLGASLDDHHIILKEFQNKNISLEDAIQQIVMLWGSTGKATRSNIQKILLSNIILRKGAKEFIKSLIKRGMRVVLLTNTPDSNLRIITDLFPGVEAFTSTSFIFDSNDYLINFTYPLDIAKYKVDTFNQYLQNNNLSKEECAMIGNGLNDLDVIKMCGFSAAPKIGSEKDILATVNYIFDDFTDLQQFLK